MLDRRMWDEQFELLAKTHRVLRYDADAHGNSTLPPDAYWDSFESPRASEHLEIDRAILVGLSLGGKTAIDLALEDPERVEAIVAVSSGLSGYRFTSDFYLEYRDVMIQAWRAGEFDAVVEAFQRPWTDGPHRAPEDVDPEVREKVRMMARNGLEHAMEGRPIDPPATERLGRTHTTDADGRRRARHAWHPRYRRQGCGCQPERRAGRRSQTSPTW